MCIFIYLFSEDLLSCCRVFGIVLVDGGRGVEIGKFSICFYSIGSLVGE